MHQYSEKPKGWRNNWFVKNILAELPIIGAFFHTAEIPHALHHAGKSAAMLVGGTTGMMLDIIQTDETDSMAVSMTKTTTNMAIGMAAGNMAYNTVYSLGNAVYQRIKPISPPNSNSNDLLIETENPENEEKTDTEEQKYT